jgi:hypothetical protein
MVVIRREMIRRILVVAKYVLPIGTVGFALFASGDVSWTIWLSVVGGLVVASVAVILVVRHMPEE